MQSEDDIRQFLIFRNLVSASGLLIVFISFFILFIFFFFLFFFFFFVVNLFYLSLVPFFHQHWSIKCRQTQVLDPSTPRVSLLRTKHDRAFTSKFFCRSYCYLCCVGCIYLVICLYIDMNMNINYEYEHTLKDEDCEESWSRAETIELFWSAELARFVSSAQPPTKWRNQTFINVSTLPLFIFLSPCVLLSSFLPVLSLLHSACSNIYL